MQASWSNDSISNPGKTETTSQEATASASGSSTLQTSNRNRELLPTPYSSKLFDPLLPRKHHTRQRSETRKEREVRAESTHSAAPAPANTYNRLPNRTNSRASNSPTASISSINPNPQTGPYFTQTAPHFYPSPTPSIISSSHTASSAGIEADRDSHLDLSSSSELDHYVIRNRKKNKSSNYSRKLYYPPSSSGGGATSNGRAGNDATLSEDETTASEEGEDDWLNQTTSEEGGGGASRRFDWDRRGGGSGSGSGRNSVRNLNPDGSGTGSGETHRQKSQVNQKRATFDVSNLGAGGYFASLGRRRGSAPDISDGKVRISGSSSKLDQDSNRFDSHHEERPSWLDTGILPSASEDEVLSNSKQSPISKGLRRFSSRDADRPSRSSSGPAKRSSFNFGLSDATRARLRAVLPNGMLSSELLGPDPNDSREARRSSAGTVRIEEFESSGGRIRSYSPAPTLRNGSSGPEEVSDRSRGKRPADGTGSSSGEASSKPRRSSRLSHVDLGEFKKEGRASNHEELVEEDEGGIQDDEVTGEELPPRSRSPGFRNSSKREGESESKPHFNTLQIPTSDLRHSPRKGTSQLPPSPTTSNSRQSASNPSQPLSPTSQSFSTRRPPPRISRKRTRLRASLHSHLQTSAFRITLSSFLEGLILLLPAYYAIYRLSTREMANVGGRHTEMGKVMTSAALELSWVAVSSTIYWLIKKRDRKGANSSGPSSHSSSKGKERDKMEVNAIWATDERNYRNCRDDGVLYGLLFGPLLACTSFFAALPSVGGLSPSKLLPTSSSFFEQVKNSIQPLSSNLPQAFLLPPQNPILLHSRALPFPPLPLARASLITIQSLTSTALLAHLLATKWIRKPSEFDKSNWKRMRSFFGFSLILVMGMETIREGSSFLGIGFWTGLSRWELFTASLVYQLNLYTISRLARRSFTLGELAIVATLGVTLLMESIYLTIAKLWPLTTDYVKTFRHPTPLVIFQLALVVGTFMIGFLLSPLLYLSRNLAQKPLHRLRWPAKRDLHRRLLAGFFYFFAAAFVVGVLGMWVRWLLGNRDAWIWVAMFVVEGKYQWSRPLLMAYWLGLVSISVIGWQTVVVRNKRVKLRAGSARNMNLNGINSKINPVTSINRNLNHLQVPPSPHSISAIPSPEGDGNGQAGMEIVDSRHSQAGSTTTSVSLGLGDLSNLSSPSAALMNQPAVSTPLSPPIQSTPVGLSFTTPNPIESHSSSSSHLKKAAHLSLNAKRKFFHALAVLMFVPGILFDPAFTHLAFSLGFSLFIFGEYVRYYALYPFGATLHIFLSEFLDSKDSGPVILSHFYLLTGCAGPLWLEGESIIIQLTGVLVLGVGDALASIVGRRYGRKKWWTGSKTVEGTLAFWSSIMFCAWLLRIFGFVEQFSLVRYSVLIAILALLEGVSAQNDNLVLPAFGSILATLLEI